MNQYNELDRLPTDLIRELYMWVDTLHTGQQKLGEWTWDDKEYIIRVKIIKRDIGKSINDQTRSKTGAIIGDQWNREK